MSNPRNTFLAGLAALALVAGVSAAAAQNSPQDQNAAPQAKQPNAAHQMNNASNSGKLGQSAQNKTGQSGQNKMGQNKMDQMGQNKMGQSAQNQKAGPQRKVTGRHTAQIKRGSRTRTAQSNMHKTAQRNGMQGLQGNAANMKGLQGNASETNIQLNDAQRTQIRNTVLNARGAPRLDNANFNVAVGTVIPRTGVRVVAVSPALVRINPRWRGFRYFVWQNDVVIVNPRDMTIVAVLNT
jgi:Protein of unknown function (DUF1236)